MIIGILSFIIFLFIVFRLAKEDFMLSRKNVAIEEIFNAIFIGVIFVALSARIAYVILHPRITYLNPFVFFLVPYFPGLFAGGGIVGGILFLSVYTKNKKLPFLRLLDITGLAFLCSTVCYYVLTALVTGISSHQLSLATVQVLVATLYLISYTLSRLVFMQDKWRDGAIGFMAIVFYCVFSLFYETMLVFLQRKLLVRPEDIFYIALLVISILIFVKQQYIGKEGR